MVCLRSHRKLQVSKGGIFMVAKYGIVPFRAQEERPPSTKDSEPSERSHPVGYLQGSLDLTSTKDSEPGERSQRYGMNFLRFLEPLLRELDVTVDKRPLRTLVQTVEAIVSFRDQNHGLLLSELGGYMDGLGHGGGTKRLSTLIHHKGWKAQQIEAF